MSEEGQDAMEPSTTEVGVPLSHGSEVLVVGVHDSRNIQKLRAAVVTGDEAIAESMVVPPASTAPAEAGLTFAYLAAANLSRALVWHKGGLEKWSVPAWACAMAGEAGEVCNAVKKLHRIECDVQQKQGPANREQAVAEIAKEIGDTLLYLDLLAQRLGINLAQAVIDTYNRVSIREGFPHRLRATPTRSAEEEAFFEAAFHWVDTMPDGNELPEPLYRAWVALLEARPK